MKFGLIFNNKRILKQSFCMHKFDILNTEYLHYRKCSKCHEENIDK
jgi:hypothetical protein